MKFSFNRVFNKFFIVLTLSLLMLPNMALAAGGSDGVDYPFWTVIPFAGMLLSIAICPLVNSHWWEHNMGKVALFWALLFTIPSGIMWGFGQAWYEFVHIMVVDYVPFICLVAGLFVVAGGINVGGKLPSTPMANSVMLLIGTCLASIVGTTGATMLVIRPIIKANQERKMKMHTIIFLIFLVSNIGGSLTPVGDPPLFLGFLHGVPFFWTLKLLPEWLLNVTVLLTVYYGLDTFFYKRHLLQINEDEVAGKVSVALSEQAMKETVNEVFNLKHEHNAADSKIKITGLQNLIFLFGILLAVVMSGTMAQHPMFFDKADHTLKGITLMNHADHDFVLPYLNLARDLFIILMAILSLKFTSKEIREANKFTWMPVEEVALLFAGIFATIVPALKILSMHGSELGVSTPMQFFWASGMLSSFLDNAPTYLVFTSMAAQMGSTTGVLTDMGMINETILKAISCGAVFMGANTYIGNAPNFMTKSIAEENNIRMPSFFGYMLWSGAILIPLFILNTVIFFR